MIATYGLVDNHCSVQTIWIIIFSAGKQDYWSVASNVEPNDIDSSDFD